MTNAVEAAPPIKGFKIVKEHWYGKPCAVLSMPFCNFRCPYCFSRGLVLSPGSLKTYSLEQILLPQSKKMPQTVCVTGGEPLMHRKLPVLLTALKQAGHEVLLETNGSQPEILELLITQGLVDHVCLDLKAPLDDDLYSLCAGVHVPAALISMSLDVLKKTRVPSTLSHTCVPGLLEDEHILLLAQQAAPVGLLHLREFEAKNLLDRSLKNRTPYSKSWMEAMQTRINATMEFCHRQREGAAS